jgi:hypothetical protein
MTRALALAGIHTLAANLLGAWILRFWRISAVCLALAGEGEQTARDSENRGTQALAVHL